MGVNYDDQITQDNFRVIYHEVIDYNITEEYIVKLNIKSSLKAESHPVKGEYKITLIKNKDYINIHDITNKIV